MRADTFTVRTQLGKLRNLLREKSQVEFWQLFPPNTCKLEMIVTFMALLDMLTRGEVHIQQNQPYAPIRILRGNLLGEDDRARPIWMKNKMDGERMDIGKLQTDQEWFGAIECILFVSGSRWIWCPYSGRWG